MHFALAYQSGPVEHKFSGTLDIENNHWFAPHAMFCYNASIMWIMEIQSFDI